VPSRTNHLLLQCDGRAQSAREKPDLSHIVEDYRSTFKRAALLDGDVFLAPHPEMYNMEEKRAQIAEGKPNPFVKPGEFQAYVGTLKTHSRRRSPNRRRWRARRLRPRRARRSGPSTKAALVLVRARGFFRLVDGLPCGARRRLPCEIVLVDSLALPLSAIRLMTPMPEAARIDVIVAHRMRSPKRERPQPQP
jgi:hypothetical protein